MSYHILHLTTPNCKISVDKMRQANRSRKDLLNQGYFMLQNSIYVRSYVTYDRVEQYERNLMLIAPETGLISAFFITDKQWGQSICIEKNNYLKSKYKKKTGEHKEQQMTFW